MERLPWYVAGPLAGLIVVAWRAAANKPLGALGGWIDLAETRGDLRRGGLRMFLLLGVVLGGALFANATGTFGLLAVDDRIAGVVSAPTAVAAGALVLAGFLMGFGARTAGGCTSGHGMTGSSLGSPGSMAATMTFMATAVGVSQLIAAFFGSSS